MTTLSANDIVSYPKALEAPHIFSYLQGVRNSNQRTRNQFRPRNATKGTTSYQLRQYAEATLGGGSLRKIVKLPEGEDENEWLAVNSEFLSQFLAGFGLTQPLVVDFYNHINLLYGSITEFCSPQSCPEMKATDEYVYGSQHSKWFTNNHQIRVLMAGFRQLQETHEDASANIHRAFDGMGPKQHRQRGRVPKQNRLVDPLLGCQ
jgi:hypothetical protein